MKPCGALYDHGAHPTGEEGDWCPGIQGGQPGPPNPPVRIEWNDPTVEARWQPEKVRALALEYAIRATGLAVENDKASADWITTATLQTARRYQQFIEGIEE